MAKEEMILENLGKKQLQKLFKMLCLHRKEYKEGESRFPDVWQDCKSCILRDISWNLPGSTEDSTVGLIVRDLCFAIWHEDILNG